MAVYNTTLRSRSRPRRGAGSIALRPSGLASDAVTRGGPHRAERDESREARGDSVRLLYGRRMARIRVGVVTPSARRRGVVSAGDPTGRRLLLVVYAELHLQRCNRGPQLVEIGGEVLRAQRDRARVVDDRRLGEGDEICFHNGNVACDGSEQIGYGCRRLEC